MPQARRQTSERRRTSRRGGSTPSTTSAQRDELRHELRQISDNDDTAIAGLVAIRVEEAVESSDLDAKTFSLVNLAALIATGGDDASYLLHVGAALDAGASVDEVTGVLDLDRAERRRVQDGRGGRPARDGAGHHDRGGRCERRVVAVREPRRTAFARTMPTSSPEVPPRRP